MPGVNLRRLHVIQLCDADPGAEVMANGVFFRCDLHMGRFLTGRRFLWLLLLTLGTLPGPAKAILIIGDLDSSGNPLGGQNTSAPTGALADSGFQFEGLWQGLTATAIAPNYFITATHLGGNIGSTFTYEGNTYATTAKFTDPNSSDLTIWQVNGTFANFAPIYTGNDEAGQTLVTYGRGGPQGSSTANGVQLGGWTWTGPSTALSWGTNTVVSAGSLPDAGPTQYLVYQFNEKLGPNTGALTAGDSGGGVFIQKNGLWQLAGVNSLADGTYNTVSADDPNLAHSPSFSGSLYNATGLYLTGDTIPISATHFPSAIMSESYSSRVSTELNWIIQVTGVPEPSSFLLFAGGLAIGAPVWYRRRRLSRSTSRDVA